MFYAILVLGVGSILLGALDARFGEKFLGLSFVVWQFTLLGVCGVLLAVQVYQMTSGG